MVERVVQNEVRADAATSARFQAADFGSAGEIRAKALQGLGQSIGEVGKAVDEITYKFDVAAAKKAEGEDAIKLAGIQATALTAVGDEAPAAVEAAHKAAEELKRTRLASMKGRRGALYSTSFSERMASFEGSITAHGLKQGDVALRSSSAALAENSLELAVLNHDDREDLKTNFDNARKNFDIANHGTPKATLDREWKNQLTKTHTSIVKSIMAKTPEDPGKAAQWIDDHIDQIAPDSESDLRRLLQPRLEEEETDADFGRVMAFAGGHPDATVPDDGEDDASAPTPATPRQKGEPVANVFSHVVSGKGGRISSGFGHRSSPTAGASTNHGGVDIPAPEGTPIRPPMSGRVVKSWFDGEHGGGWSVLVQHPNGMVTGYAHMRSKPTVDAGDEVESTSIIGSVGHTGTATGNHLHFTTRKAGVKVDPQSVDWAAVGSSGPRTTDPSKVKWHEGDLPRYTADKNQVGALLDATYQVATKEGWSAKRYERQVTKIRQFAGVNEQVFNARYDDMKDKVYNSVADLEGGDGLTSFAQLPPEAGQLKGSDRLSLANMMQANKKALATGEKVPANGPGYSEAVLMASNPDMREAFLKERFETRTDMTPAERTRLRVQQQGLRNDTDGKLAASSDKVYSLVNRYAPEGGFDVGKANKGGKGKAGEDRQKRALLVERVTTLIHDGQKARGRELNPEELDAIVRSQVVAVHRGGTTVPLYQARNAPRKAGEVDSVNPQEVYDSIPKAARDAIIEGLSSSGRRVTPRDVIQAYMRGR